MVIEDYVHTKWLKWAMLIKLTIGTLLFSAASLYSVIAIALKG